jgi:hypothetical protein
LFDGGGNGFVGCIRREGEVPRALLRLTNDASQPPVCIAPPTEISAGLRRRREQRMREANAFPVELDRLALESRTQPLPVISRKRCMNGLDRRIGGEGRDQERLTRLDWEPRKPIGDDILQRPRTGKRIAGIDVSALVRHGAANLDCEERIAAGGLSDPPERRSQESKPKPRVDHLVERAEAERADPNSGDLLIRKCAGETEWRALVTLGATRKQKFDPLARQAPDKELKRAA